mgnify:CR=1 FL=1
MLLWNFDPAASGDRWNAYVGPETSNWPVGNPFKYRLCAYEDGRWFVDHRGMTVASGTSQSLKHAKQIATLVYEFTLDPGKSGP